ncbi:MAG: TIGR00303 family protein [Synergistaceae bacterium]|jgi:uncharacterized protein (TIGR00303 family)|nr:TIGR00303 family protein [Synergistaceae bacterium]
MFFLFIGSTELSKIPGVSAAGANPDIAELTPSADADFIRSGRSEAMDFPPMDPEGHPTPALITRAAVLEARIPVCVVRAGSCRPPAEPYVELGAGVGRNPCAESAVPDAALIYARARQFAENFGSNNKWVMIAESVPGGTTTALLTLRAMGYRGMVSSASRVNPTALKEKIWQDAQARRAASGTKLKSDPISLITEYGDPMQAAVLGFIDGLDRETEIILAGGTQMLAIAALASRIDASFNPLVATTKYVAADESSSFNELASALDIRTYLAPLDFSDSPHMGLQDYEKGCVKEGAGAGGAVLYAGRKGVGIERIIARTNEIYSNTFASHR